MAVHPEPRLIAGRELRYVLTLTLMHAGSLTVRELVGAVERRGFSLGGRPSKTVSDALRWEIRRGRVVRVGRGRYATGSIPRSTRSWIRARVAMMQRQSAADQGGWGSVA
jgi:hypothetical protein